MTGTVNFVTNYALVVQMVRLFLAPLVEPPENSCRMNRVFSIFLLLPVTAMAICRRKPLGSVFRQHKRGILGAVGHCEEFDPVLVHRSKVEEKDFIDKMGVFDVVPVSAAAEKGCRVFGTRWVTVNKGSDEAPQLRARWVAQEFRGRCGEKHEYF